MVREGVKYRGRRGPSISQEEILGISALLEELGLRIPSPLDPAFLAALPKSPGRQVGRGSPPLNPAKLAQLRDKFRMIESNPDPQSRGYELQEVPYGLFELFGLTPAPAVSGSGRGKRRLIRAVRSHVPLGGTMAEGGNHESRSGDLPVEGSDEERVFPRDFCLHGTLQLGGTG